MTATGVHIPVERLGETGVFREDGERVPLCGFWQEQTAVLVFVRHFG